LLSSFLDNAPTYLVFFHVAGNDPVALMGPLSKTLTAISLGASGGPERRTDIVVLGSGHEERNQRWADSRRRYEAGYGIKSLDDLQAVIAFFEERRGRLHGFRWKDHADYKSCLFTSAPMAEDQTIGTGDGVLADFRLVKRYGAAFSPWLREITKPDVVCASSGVRFPSVPGALESMVSQTTPLSVNSFCRFCMLPPP